MKITNKFSLPSAFVNAVKNDGYTKGEKSDFSCTELLQPPRLRALKKKHWNEIEEDASDRVWSLLGQAVHTILERANSSDLAEKRFYATFDGFVVSAQIDTLCLQSGILSDYKVQSVYKFKTNQSPDPSWIAQLNIQLEILRQNGIEANELKIVGILRDFSQGKAMREEDFPNQPVVVVPIEIWPREKTVAFIKERIELMRAAEVELPLCTEEERWATPAKWAIMKKGAKRALRLLETESEAIKYSQTIAGGFVEHRPGKANRCAMYCPVKDFCSQYLEEINKTKEEVEE